MEGAIADCVKTHSENSDVEFKSSVAKHVIKLPAGTITENEELIVAFPEELVVID